jgi:hypothetical protein
MSQHGTPEPHGNPFRHHAAPHGPGAGGADDRPLATRYDEPLRMNAVTDLAADHPPSRFDRILQWIPRILSSKPHIVLLTLLGIYLVLVPLLGIVVSAKAELIGGNYTNVTSDIGACIAAGGTLHLVNQGRKRQKVDAERLRLLREVHALLHHVHADTAASLGQPAQGPAPEE